MHTLMGTPQSPEAQAFIRAWQEGTTLPPFISRAICKPWDKPIPGPSLIWRVRDKQIRDRSWPADTGSLHMPPREYAEPAIADCLNIKPEDHQERMFAEEVQKNAALAELEDLDISRGNLRKSIELGNIANDLLLQRVKSGDTKAALECAGLPALSTGECSTGAQEEPAPVASASRPMSEAPEQQETPETPTEPESGTATGEGARATNGRVFEMPRLRTRKPKVPKVPVQTASGPNATGGGARATATPAELAAGSARVHGEIDDIISRGSSKSDKRAAMQELSARDLLAIAHRGNQCAWMLARVAVLRRKAADNLVQAHLRANRKMEFYNSRAHGIIVQSFLAIEDVFRHAGFGGWMPFRYADQWLAFTDVMRKICAANNLISPCGPNHWARFIEETPNVPIEKEFPQAPLQMPEGIGATKKYREIADFDELVARARGAPQ
jgi:hypothetical protein